MGINKLTLGRSLWRIFFLQAAWNYQGQQNLGFTAAVLPVLEKVYPRGAQALTAAVRRCLEPFNTQPYMAGLVVGSLLKAEELAAAGGLDPRKLDRFKTALMTALAALGDAFFWNALLPAAGVAGMFWAVKADLTGMVVFLAAFNLGHLVLRCGGFWLGYRYGMDMVPIVERFSFPRWTLVVRLMSAAGLGALTAWSLKVGTSHNWSRWEYWAAGLLAGPGVYLTSRLLRRNVPVEAVIYGLLAVLLVWTYFFKL